ncbi:hypothetical protein BH20ACT6_BH20ACT6_14050 [soil metagenome]
MLRIYLAGRVMIESADTVLDSAAFPGRQGRLAFAYLAVAPRRVDRDQLAEVLWPDGVPAAWDPALSAVVSKLRRLLAGVGDHGGDWLEGVRGGYELRLPAGSWIDLRQAVNCLDRAEGAVASGEGRAGWSNAAVATAILRRPFLPGDTGPWADDTRRMLHDYEVRAYETLAGAWLLCGNAEAAAVAARTAVDLAPFRESCYARLMRAHLSAGNRAEAVRVYHELSGLLRESLGVSPAGEVEQLFRRALG